MNEVFSGDSAAWTQTSPKGQSHSASLLLFTLELTPHPSDWVFMVDLVVEVSYYRTIEQKLFPTDLVIQGFP